jgi:hypothetical protein
MAWQVAEQFPSARVIGTDLSPIQPHWTPTNCEFHVEDLEDELRPWTSIYKDADLIHTRSLLQTLRHPRALIHNIFEYAAFTADILRHREHLINDTTKPKSYVTSSDLILGT